MSGDLEQAVLMRAIQAAAQQARWEALDLLARKGRQSAPDLLRGRAAELAFGPAGYDQLLSLALEQGACAVDEGAMFMVVDLRSLLCPSPLPPAHQARILEQAAQLADADETDPTRRPASRAETDGDGTTQGFSRTEDGRLCRRLWSDSRIPAGDATRARMALSGERLDFSGPRTEPRPSGLSLLGSWARRLIGRQEPRRPRRTMGDHCAATD